jgi:hypothetical protein
MYTKRKRRTIIALLLAFVLAAAAYAFTASNTVAGGSAGDGSGAISGYTVTATSYTLNAADPSLLDKVSFNVGAAANSVKARTNNMTAGVWMTCASTGGTNWECTFPAGVTVVAATSLQVVAAS